MSGVISLHSTEVVTFPKPPLGTTLEVTYWVFPGGPVGKTPRSPMQGAQFRALVGEPDPTCRN